MQKHHCELRWTGWQVEQVKLKPEWQEQRCSTGKISAETGARLVEDAEGFWSTPLERFLR